MLTSDCLAINELGHLTIGGCDTVLLAETFGTALYVMSEDKIREICKKYVASIQKYYNGFGVPIYASKAFCCKEICRIVASEGLDMDAVSMGEIYTAVSAGIDPVRIHFHGNNKTLEELEYAVKVGVGDIVADNFEDIKRINTISRANNKISNVSLRIKPGIDAHTHQFIRTGQIDSKFGFALETGEALEAVQAVISKENLHLTGLHCHIGSQIFDIEPFVHAARVMIEFYHKIREELGVELAALNLGGGFGIKYVAEDNAVPYEDYMKEVSQEIHARCKEISLKVPKIYIEPGRSIVGEAGITLYTVGNIKEIPGVRNYVAVDGGMGDNPRYALYSSEYTCVLANKMNMPAEYRATIAGKCCESGDLIQEGVMLPKPEPGDILAVLSTGAYNYSMASNYNRNPKLACVMVRNSEPRIIIRRESLEDLVRNDI